ncbi:MAG: LysR family transcriptional regulator [Hyphomicrobiaceae bacterium]|nr:LysR family transcriptional regulator [Hyphomicrobiaceae bacterium]
MLTLRQIEVIRAIMITGTVGDAARMLNVSSPGVSRAMKHAESTLGFKLFHRKGGRYTPTLEAKDIFAQVNSVYDKVEDLQYVIAKLKKGEDVALSIGAVPSLATVMVPRAIADIRRRYPDLSIALDIIKVEDATDYLLMGKGEAVAMSYRFDHAMLLFEPLAEGQLKCVVPVGHPLASRAVVSVKDIAKYPLIGIDPGDPYGRIMARHFHEANLDYNVIVQARFGFTVAALVEQGLGIAVLDEFTIAARNWPGTVAIDISEPTKFQTYIASRKDATLSSYCTRFVQLLRTHMTAKPRPATVPLKPLKPLIETRRVAQKK